jgi:hypothetical protein
LEERQRGTPTPGRLANSHRSRTHSTYSPATSPTPTTPSWESEWDAAQLTADEKPFNFVIRLRALAARCRGGKSEREVYKRFITAVGPYGRKIEAKVREAQTSLAYMYSADGRTPPTLDDEAQARRDLDAAITHATTSAHKLARQGAGPRAKASSRPSATKPSTLGTGTTPSGPKSPTQAREDWLAKAKAFQASHPISAKPWPPPRTAHDPANLARQHCWNCGRTGHMSVLCEEERRNPELVARELFGQGKE